VALGRTISFVAAARVAVVTATVVTGGEATAEPVSFPFELVDDTLIVVRGSVGHLSDLQFVIDTGATRTYVDRRVAATLGLRATWSRPLRALEGRGQAEGITLPSLHLGSIRTGLISGLMTDLSPACRSRHVDAVIGMDLLRLGNFEIDYAARRIVFEPADEIPHEVPFASMTPLLSIDASIEGQPVRLMVDTAARAVTLFTNHMQARLPRFRLLGQTAVATAVGTSLAREVDLGTVHLGRTPWPRRAFLVEVTAEPYAGLDGILGAWPQTVTRVRFDFRRQRLGWAE
jgi:predicted aspartyl protease